MTVQLSGLRYGSRLLSLVDFPVAETLGPNASDEEIQAFLDRHGKALVKPVFHGGVGRKGKAGLIRVVDSLRDALAAKRELYFATHRHGARVVTANGVSFEAFVPSEIEIYFSIDASTAARAPVFTISPRGGVDIEGVPPAGKQTVEIDPFLGISSFEITNALIATGCPEEFISPLVQHLPKLWDLYAAFGLTTVEINPIRVRRDGARLVPVACDVKAEFDRDNPAWKRLELPPTIFQSEVTPFEADVNELRTHQGQSDVLELSPGGTIVPFMFGGGASSAATEALGSAAIFSSDFGGNPPYEKMYDIASIVFRHWLDRASVLLVIGGKANNTDIHVTFKGIFDALRDHVVRSGTVPPVYTVIGRGGPNLVKGMFYAKDILDTLRLPYRMFGFDTSMILVLEYARRIDEWWRREGRDLWLAARVEAAGAAA
ncbi:MAG TPA: ATP citrate lyase citrate-binding domain-containing protein [Anaeromyxobacteraceae bacterium]|nr:ATP citrate lyase citrate-binding domain-containing protein [Anaeromyxobacteraceae bacterium]